jgi:hypothetical protein
LPAFSAASAHVGLGDGQVQHDVDVVAGQQMLDRHRPADAVLLDRRLRAGRIHVGHGGDLDDGKFPGHLQVSAADRATTDHSDPDL